MSILSSLTDAVSGLLNGAAALAMFVPGGQLLTVAALVSNVVKGLAQSPPNWKGIITNLLAGAIPMGLGKALSAFTSGTALDFAKLFGDKLSGVLGDVAKKVANPQFTNIVGQLQQKVVSPEFTSKFAGVVSAATHTKPGATLTAAQIKNAMGPISFQAQGLLSPIAGVLAYPMEAARSMYYENMVHNATKLPPPVHGDPIVSSAPTMRVVPGYRG